MRPQDTFSLTETLHFDTEAVSVKVLKRPPAVAVSPADGRLEELAVSAGSPIQTGNHLLTLDGVRLYAYVASRPPPEDFSVGTNLDDPKAFRRLVGSDATGGEATREDLRAAQSRFPGMTCSERCEIAMRVVWVPSPSESSATAGDVRVAVGQSVSVGEPLLDLSDDPLDVRAQPIGADIAFEDWVLVGNGTEFGLDESGRVTPEDSVGRASALAGSPDVTWFVRARKGVEVVTVPAEAVLVGSGGERCLVVEDGSVTRVTVRSEGVGWVLIDPLEGHDAAYLTPPTEQAERCV